MPTTEPTPEESKLLKTQQLLDAITSWVVVASIGLVLWGVGILVWQIWQWLKDGYWTPLAWNWGLMWFGIGYPTTHLRGVQKIINWFMELPLCTMPFTAGVALLMGWLAFADSRADEARQIKNKADAFAHLQAEEAKFR